MKYSLGLSLLGLVMGGAADLRAGDGCDQCGCCEVRKVCKVECGTKKVKKTVWGCKCEDVCLPGYVKGRHCGGGLKGLFSKHRDGCDGGCNAIDCNDGCQDVSHCNVRSRKKLIRYEVEEEVPIYKWKVEYVCGCGAGCCDIGCTGRWDGGSQPDVPPDVAPSSPPLDAAGLIRIPRRTVFNREAR